MINVKVLIASCNKIFISSFTDAGAAAVTPSVDPLFCQLILKYWCTVKRQKKKIPFKEEKEACIFPESYLTFIRKRKSALFEQRNQFFGAALT